MKPSHLIAACVASMCLWAGIGASVAMVVTAQEDDALANCWVYGDHDCGSQAPWHGFVNGFKHADER
jgi:hypothetical protein